MWNFPYDYISIENKSHLKFDWMKIIVKSNSGSSAAKWIWYIIADYRDGNALVQPVPLSQLVEVTRTFSSLEIFWPICLWQVLAILRLHHSTAVEPTPHCIREWCHLPECSKSFKKPNFIIRGHCAAKPQEERRRASCEEWCCGKLMGLILRVKRKRTRGWKMWGTGIPSTTFSSGLSGKYVRGHFNGTD